MDLYQQIFFSTLAFAFGLLHFILFLYNRRSIGNLYFALFSLFYAINIFFDFQLFQAESAEKGFLYLRIHRATLPFSMIFALLFIYSLSKSKIPKQFWIIAGGFLITGIIAIAEPIKNFYYMQILFIAVFIEAIRLTIVGIKRKTEGVWIIAVGFALLWIFSSYRNGEES